MLAEASTIYRTSFAAGLRPDADVLPSDWAEAHREVPPETSAYPGRWRNAFVPFATEIMDCMAPSHPCETVTWMKSAQVSGSELITNTAFWMIKVAPGPGMIIHPTVESGQDWVTEKFDPSIEATKIIRKAVRETVTRDGKGSTSKYKRFKGGFLRTTGANSTRALRQKSIRWMWKDDWDDWPLDLDKQGDPDKMADARQISYTRAGLAKQMRISTPTLKPISRVYKAFEEGDQRRYHVPCPDCGHEQVLTWKNLKYSKEPPHRAAYQCADCGVLIPHHRKTWMLARGSWVADAPGPGRQPSFHINALYSPVTTWDKMVEEFIAAKDDPSKLKTWVNLWLGEPWEDKGEAPDEKHLLLRREDYPLRRVPPGGLILTAGVDIGKDHIYYEVVAWGPGKTSWSIDFGMVEHNLQLTASAETLEALITPIYERRYQNAWGREWPIDQIAVDANYNTQAVYSWVRGRSRAIAVRGRAGFAHPPLGTPSKQDVTYVGSMIKGGVMLWPVGTYPLKSEFYANLRKPGPADGAESFPLGYCHFSKLHDDAYFKQVTAEHLTSEVKKGRTVYEWVARGANHFHDCRIYAMAAAERLGISRFGEADWRKLVALRCDPEPGQQSLEHLMANLVKPTGEPVQEAPAAPEPPAQTTTSRPVRRRAARSRFMQ